MNDATGRALIPVLMCGGAGTRLWPVSRESMPKQFVPLIGSRSTFQQTLERVADPALFARPIVIDCSANSYATLPCASVVRISFGMSISSSTSSA